MLDAACMAKLATWACTAVAATLKAHDIDVAFFAVLADLGGRTIEAGHALRDRPRDVLRKAADRLATCIAREHATWLAREFGGDAAGRQDAQAALAALPDVIGKFLPIGLDCARADLDAARIANEVVTAASVDEQFLAGTFGGRVLHARVAGAFTAARGDEAFVRDMRFAIDQVLLERSRQTTNPGHCRITRATRSTASIYHGGRTERTEHTELLCLPGGGARRMKFCSVALRRSPACSVLNSCGLCHPTDATRVACGRSIRITAGCEVFAGHATRPDD